MHGATLSHPKPKRVQSMRNTTQRYMYIFPFQQINPNNPYQVPIVDTRGLWSRHLVIWSRNHEHSILSRNDHWSYYQSMDSEFRYVLGKVLGTQDRPNLRLASHLCVLRLNLIKSMFNTCIYTHTHTHTSIHLSIQHGIFHLIQNIIIHLPKQKRTKHIKETLVCETLSCVKQSSHPSMATNILL